jgi:hypothetical protein
MPRSTLLCSLSLSCTVGCATLPMKTGSIPASFVFTTPVSTSSEERTNRRGF